MAIFSRNNLKTEKDSDKQNVLDMVKEPAATDKKESTPVVPKENTGRAHHILKHYHLSEKSNLFSQTGRYVFRVAKTSNKIEVKKAVEQVYDVHVTSVNMISVGGKKRRQGRSV